MSRAYNIHVRYGQTSRIVIGDGGLSALRGAAAGGKVFVVADRRVMHLHSAHLVGPLEGAFALLVHAGERAKTRRNAALLQDALLAARVERSDLLVAVGGGVISDLVGFTAATCLRGIRFITVSTTLVGMVDAAIGGKTGVNTSAGKNTVGVFYWPEMVIADTQFLVTLPPVEMRQGIAEMVKHGVIQGGQLLDAIEREATSGHPPSCELIARSAEVKVDIVNRDPFEQGERRCLNLGHTIGHAIEGATGFKVRHGDAVAAGLAVAMRVASRVTRFPDADRKRVEGLLVRLGLPVTPQCPFTSAVPYLLSDKKVKERTVRMALPRQIGEMESASGEWAVEVDLDTIERCWDA